MLLMECCFNDYYRQYLTIEADELTEQLNHEVVDIQEDDCYALCSSYVDEDGFLQFNVLGVGSTWENCTRGLEKDEMLGTFMMQDVMKKTMRIVDPSFRMVEKNIAFQESFVEDTGSFEMQLRTDKRFDDIRDYIKPDQLMVGLPLGEYSYDYAAEFTSLQGPFLVGTMCEEVEEDGTEVGDTVYALPYIIDNQISLFGFAHGKEESEEQKERIAEVTKAAEELGIEFVKDTMKN